MTSLSEAEVGKASKRKPGLGPATMESARRFLYDEDVPAPTGNVPVRPPRKTSLSGGDRRLNPIQAVFMETKATCQTYGNKRLFYVAGVIIGIVLISMGVHSISTSGPKKTGAQRLQAFQAKILEAQVTTQEDFTKVGSVQYHALQWLTNNDESGISEEDEGMIPRYIMAVLFYSLSADKDHVKPDSGWADQTGWMTADGYCSWYGVVCVGGDEVTGNGKIESITLEGNALSGKLPSEIAGLDSLNILNLKNNDIGGTLPSELATAKDLRFLLLSSNNIEGTIPTEFGAFTSMRHLDLGHNQLTGSIPSELEKSFTMRTLDLQSNNLEGHIPEFVEFEGLAELNLQNNNLKGKLPPSFAKLTGLVDLRLSNNTLTGQLPEEMEDMTNLGRFERACLCVLLFIHVLT